MQHVAQLSSLQDGKPVTVQLGDTGILLLRDRDTVRAFSATCPHAGAPLDQAAVCQGRLICPWHKAMFDIRDGALLEPPALAGLARYPVRLEGDAVWVSPEPIAAPASPCEAAPDPRVMVIVGAGVAGAAGAAALREFGFTGRVVLIGHEPGEPFDRTALSKFVLEGGMAPGAVPSLWPDDFLATHRIEHLHDTVTGLDPASRRLTLASGAGLSYDAVLLAPGGTPRPLDVPGGDSAMVCVLRDRADASALLAKLQGQPRVVIVGGSFIGLEAASALRQRDVPVTVISPDEIPLAQALGRETGAALRRLHEANGVVFRGSARVAAIEPGHVRLHSGERIAAELVLAGTGIRPATGFASALHPAGDGALDTDAGMRVTDGVFAAGDVARFPFGDGRVRVEHYRVAQQQARVASANMLGGNARFQQPPFFWTYHYGRRIEVHGRPARIDEERIDGSLDAGDFLVTLLCRGRLVGLVGCGRDTALAAHALSVPFGP